MQELMVYAGQLDIYAKADEVIEKLISVKVNPTMTFRVTNHISEALKHEDDQTERILGLPAKDDVLYVEPDGCMLCTRNSEEPWKEVKLARLFKGSDCLNPNTESSYICRSQYVAHFGKSRDFCEKLNHVMNAYGDMKDRLIIISDGATWIREWIADCYPLAISILDFFHVMEHLYDFADKAFPDATQKKTWCDRQKKLLLASNVDAVIDNITIINGHDTEKKALITYYQNNKRRMDYKYYRTIGCGIIGSGAIESAHRTVVQKRMKLAGQRWSVTGIKNMLRLRVIENNNQWHKVIHFLQTSPLANSA